MPAFSLAGRAWATARQRAAAHALKRKVTKMKTITVSTWGKMGIGKIRVRRDVCGFDVDAVRKSIERRTGLSFCGGPRHDGTSLDGRGQPESRHYQGTLGRHLRTGGYSVEGELWFAIPCTH